MMPFLAYLINDAISGPFNYGGDIFLANASGGWGGGAGGRARNGSRYLLCAETGLKWRSGKYICVVPLFL